MLAREGEMPPSSEVHGNGNDGETGPAVQQNVRPDPCFGTDGPSDVAPTRSRCRGSGQGALARDCYNGASTLVQGASRGPRGGGTMTLLSGFSRYSRPETWEEVPASGAARGIEPCSPDSGSSGTSAAPLREVGEGLSHCSPEAQFERREVSDSRAANRPPGRRAARAA